MPCVYKKIDQDDEFKTLKKHNILAWTGYSTKWKIIVSIEDKDNDNHYRTIEYKFPNKYHYKEFHNRLRKITQ